MGEGTERVVYYFKDRRDREGGGCRNPVRGRGTKGEGVVIYRRAVPSLVCPKPQLSVPRRRTDQWKTDTPKPSGPWKRLRFKGIDSLL